MTRARRVVAAGGVERSAGPADAALDYVFTKPGARPALALIVDETRGTVVQRAGHRTFGMLKEQIGAGRERSTAYGNSCRSVA
jgi:hypothetical protein